MNLHAKEFAHSLCSFGNYPSHVNTHFGPVIGNTPIAGLFLSLQSGGTIHKLKLVKLKDILQKAKVAP